jgi:hypothetical protein
MIKPDWKTFLGDRIEVDNLSGYFHRILFEYIRYYGSGDNILLVSEPLRYKKLLKKWFDYDAKDIDKISYSKKHGEKYKYDLNIIQKPNKQYDVVFCQAVLEHVCRPSILIENLVNFTNEGKYIVLMSEGVPKSYHPYPIDCIRFFEDFYRNLTIYLPMELLEFEEDEMGHQFIMYKKSKGV